MPPAGHSEADIDSLYTQVQKRLVQSGEWDKISLLLKYKLNEDGWLDTVRGQAKEHARIMEPLSLRGLVQNIGPGALHSVPDSVRAHIIAVIRQFLEQQLVE